MNIEAAGPLAMALINMSPQLTAVVAKLVARAAVARQEIRPDADVGYRLMGFEENAFTRLVVEALARVDDKAVDAALEPLCEKIAELNAEAAAKEKREAEWREADFRRAIEAAISKLTIAQLVAQLERESSGKLVVRASKVALQGGDGLNYGAITKIQLRRDEILDFLRSRDQVREIES